MYLATNNSIPMEKDIRWKQRFINFEKAYLRLHESLRKGTFSDLEKAGIVQYYEFTFELAWKTLKDYLQDKGVDVKYPRDTIKEAFSTGVIENGDLWLEMLEKRNLMSHTYDEYEANQAFELIRSDFIGAINQLYLRLKELV